MNSYQELVDDLIARGRINSPQVIEAFKAVDRADFMGEENKLFAGADRALPLPYGSQTISQPSTVAFMLEQLQPNEGHKVLDVGTGSGWTIALLSHIVGENGEVYGTEIVDDLVDYGKQNVMKYNFDNWQINKAKKKVVGLPEESNFDRILVSAAADTVPEELISQLSDNGVLVIPVSSEIRRIEKTEGRLDEKSFPGFAFVPLITQDYE